MVPVSKAALAAVAPKELIYGGLLILIVMLMGIALLYIRRKFREVQPQEQSLGLDIERLEALRDAGEITPEEFSRLRRVALGLDMRARKRDDSILTGEGEVTDETRATEDSETPTEESKDE